MFNKGGMSEVIWDPLFCFLHLNIIPDVAPVFIHIDCSFSGLCRQHDLCICAEVIWRTSYNTSHVYLFLPVSYHTCATCLLFCLIYILVWWKQIKEKNPDLSSFLFDLDNQIFPVVEMVTRNGSQKWDHPPVSWLCVFVKGSGMSVLLKEFSFEISQANKVSGECVWRIFKILHHACIQTFLAFHDSAFFFSLQSCSTVFCALHNCQILKLSWNATNKYLLTATSRCSVN